jgi:hypothetical protein
LSIRVCLMCIAIKEERRYCCMICMRGICWDYCCYTINIYMPPLQRTGNLLVPYKTRYWFREGVTERLCSFAPPTKYLLPPN